MKLDNDAGDERSLFSSAGYGFQCPFDFGVSPPSALCSCLVAHDCHYSLVCQSFCFFLFFYSYSTARYPLNPFLPSNTNTYVRHRAYNSERAEPHSLMSLDFPSSFSIHYLPSVRPGNNSFLSTIVFRLFVCEVFLAISERFPKTVWVKDLPKQSQK